MPTDKNNHNESYRKNQRIKYTIIGLTAVAAVIVIIAGIAAGGGFSGNKKDSPSGSESSAAVQSESSAAGSSSASLDTATDGEINFITDSDSESVSTADAYDYSLSSTETSGTDSTKSDALNVAPGTVVTLTPDAEEASVAETVGITGANPAFTIKIEDISLTDLRNPFQEADRVARVTFTYTNNTMDTLMVGQYSFKLLDENNQACEVYYFDYSNDSEANNLPVGAGQSCTAAVGFIVPEGCHTVTLIYDDVTGTSDTELYYTKTLD